jgi:hypothetical protein
MVPVFVIYAIVFLWTAGLPDWIVAYATGVTQLGVWVTLFSLLPFSVLWISLKNGFFVENPTKNSVFHWSTLHKASFRGIGI